MPREWTAAQAAPPGDKACKPLDRSGAPHPEAVYRVQGLCNGSSCSLTAEPENGGIYQLIAFNIHTPSLSETSYTYTPAVATTSNLANDFCGLPAPNNNEMYSDFEIGDFATITISKLHDGYADGIFPATFSASGGSPKLNITDGVFKNVKIVN